MTNEAKKLIADLLELYFYGRPHNMKCDCDACQQWDVCERTPEAVFNELENESKPDTKKP